MSKKNQKNFNSPIKNFLGKDDPLAKILAENSQSNESCIIEDEIQDNETDDYSENEENEIDDMEDLQDEPEGVDSNSDDEIQDNQKNVKTQVTAEYAGTRTACPYCGCRLLYDGLTQACIVTKTCEAVKNESESYIDRYMLCRMCSGTFTARETLTNLPASV
jgi:DNA-directed RNA polymerase subunit RPC12/RpoP